MLASYSTACLAEWPGSTPTKAICLAPLQHFMYDTNTSPPPFLFSPHFYLFEIIRPACSVGLRSVKKSPTSWRTLLTYHAQDRSHRLLFGFDKSRPPLIPHVLVHRAEHTQKKPPVVALVLRPSRVGGGTVVKVASSLAAQKWVWCLSRYLWPRRCA